MSRTRLSMLCLSLFAGTLAAIAASCGPADCPTEPLAPGPALAVPSRVAARSKTEHCPKPLSVPAGEWTVEPVFKAARGRSLPPPMRGRCVYTWNGTGAPDLRGLPITELSRWSEDPVQVTPLAPTITDVLRNVRVHGREDLRKQTAVGQPVALKQQVFIGFPDTAPSNRAGVPLIPTGNVPHGFNVAWISRDLTCPNGNPCLVRPLIEPFVEENRVFGSRTALAAAIREIVSRWDDAGGEKKLILNIAAGWEPVTDCQSVFLPTEQQQHGAAPPEPRKEPDKSGGKGKEPDESGGKKEMSDAELRLVAQRVIKADPLSPPSQCGSATQLLGTEDVYVALLEASCKGALVFAAAGNNPGYSNLRGPMLPAAWQSLPRPGSEICKHWVDVDGGAPAADSGPPGPLVIAVAGVDGNDLPIAVTRLGSRPPLVAPASLLDGYPDVPRDGEGYGGAGCTAPPCDPTHPLTGTSVAVTIASSTAALVWGAHPTMSRDDVVRALYTGGEELYSKADVCFGGGPCDTIHRVALCGALEKADGIAGGTPSTTSCHVPANPPPPEDITPLLLPSNQIFAGSAAGDDTRGQPVFPCPDCVAFDDGTDASGNPQIDVKGDIYMPLVTEEGGLVSPTLVLKKADGSEIRKVSEVTWTPAPYWTVSSSQTVDAVVIAESVPASVWVTWTGNTTRTPYPQQISLPK